MDFRRIIKSSKTYLIALILASAVILYTASVGYKQVKRLQESANWVTHTFEVERTIVELFSNFTSIESRQQKFALENNLDAMRTILLIQIDTSLKKLKQLTADNASQQERIKIVERFRDSLSNINTEVKDAITQEKALQVFYKERLGGISKIVNRVRLIKNDMLLEEKRLLAERKKTYASQTFLTPLLSLLGALFSLAMFILAFMRIYKHKVRIDTVNNELTEQNRKLQETETFLKGIYKGSNNVISHFIPIKNSKDEITDFTFQYTSETIEEITGDLQDIIIGKSLLKAYPMVSENGLFALMVECYVTGNTQDHDAIYIFDGKQKHIHNSIVKTGNGVTNTGWDTTKIKDSERVLKELNEKLSLQNTIFKDSENVANIGSYVLYLDNNTATFSDNFYRILGYEPNSFEISPDKFRTFVHPDDLNFFDAITVNAVKKDTAELNEYRIITKNGQIKYLQPNGRHLDKEGRPVFLGVVQDVTSRIAKDRELKESNERLKQSNSELESFNRVASHDLQEPLRKIQMFISRIQDKESNLLSEKSKSYFDKVKNAAERMQVLIQNLLTYSRIERTHDDFEQLDLNNLLEKVKEELSSRFKETGAVISSEKLPVIRGIAFEMEQVFTNLIGNSLKYRKTDEVARIKIQAEKVNRNQIPEHFTKIDKYYHKISIIDNGIGFSQEYAEKIFEVFQRLHQKTQYSGTGIGLSICKKILENHKGHIHAEGQLGKGAAFVLYLPAI